MGFKSMIKEFCKKSFTCENIYKGIRCQIHFNKDKIQLFNTNYENITHKFPEIIGFTSIFIRKSREKNKKIINSFIIDYTFCPYDKKNDRCLRVVELT